MKQHAAIDQAEMQSLLNDGKALSEAALFPRWQPLRIPQPFEPELEAAYSRDHVVRMEPIRRTATVLTLLIWGAFIFMDFFIADHSPAYREVSPWLTAIRVLTFLVILAIAIHFFTDQRVLDEVGYADKVMLAATSIIFLSICLITALVPVPFDQLYYYNGMLVVVVASFVLYSLRGREASILASVHGVATLATVLWCHYGKDYPTVTLQEVHLFPINAIMLLGTTILICYASNLLLEAYARRNFIGRHVLAIQSEALFQHGKEMERLNRELERSGAEAQARLQSVIELKERLRQEAERRNRDKSQFIASAVHDLRQPVQAVMTALYPVQKALDQGDRQAVNELLGISSRAVSSLNDQLQAILDLSRLESGNVRPDLEIVDVRREVAAIFDSWVSSGAQQGVALRLDLPPESQRAIARTDVNFFRRVVSNLISNGIKYSAPDKPEGAYVVLSLRVHAGRLSVEVSDNGIGMDQAIIDRGQIFQPFFQANNTQAQGSKGVGLGLTIVSALVSLLPDHGLRVRSWLGEGSTFVLEMPRTDASLPDVTREAVQALDVGVLAGRYVVLVEDDDLVRHATAHLLGIIGILCDAYDSFEQFDRSLDVMERVPDVVLSDFRLPNGRSALDVGQALRELDVQVPLVVFSGEATDLSRLPGLESVPILRKPLTVEKLVQTLREVVRPLDEAVPDGD